MKLFLGILCVLVVTIFLLPTEKNESATEYIVRKILLINTPIGSDIDSMMKYCEGKRWKCRMHNNGGAMNNRTGEIIGVRSIDSEVFNSPLTPYLVISISAYWGFDEDGKLLDIFVWRIFDSL